MAHRIAAPLAGLALLAASLDVRAGEGPAVAGATPTVPFALTTSGGISLGSYEAGVNWALIEIMKRRGHESPDTPSLRPDLAVVTGASAGSINSLLSALLWCLEPARSAGLRGSGVDAENTVDANLLGSVWLDIGLEQLMPDSSREYYTRNDPDDPRSTPDALFSRKKAFAKPKQAILELLQRPVFREGCAIPMGLLVTREDPPVIVTENVRVRNQRHVFALEFFADTDGYGRFRSRKVDESDPDFGIVVYLPGWGEDLEGDVSLDPVDVVKLLFASSAFPVAFGKVELEYCTSDEQAGAASRRCPPGTTLRKASFLDGGVFDNIPLGAARALAENPDGKDRELPRREARRHWYFVISPGTRRNVEERKSEPAVAEEAEATYGLKGMTSFLSGMVATLSDYELYALLRSGKWTRQARRFSREIVKTLADLVEESTASGEVDEEFADGIADIVWKHGGQVAEPVPGNTTTSHIGNLKTLIGVIERDDAALERDSYPFVPADAEAQDPGMAGRRRRFLGLLTEVADLLGKKELANQVRQAKFDPYGERKIVVLTRHFPVTGAFLGHFFAFADRPFREFDYYAGVYDGVNALAEYVCGGMDGDPLACVGREAERLYHVLSLDGSAKARTVFALLARHEHGEDASRQEYWRWVEQLPAADPDETMALIAKSLLPPAGDPPARDDGNQAFKRFIASLHENGYVGEDPFARRILAQTDKSALSWYAPIARKAGRRLQDLQDGESKADPSTHAFNAYAYFLSLGLGRYMEDEKDFLFSPSTEPVAKQPAAGLWKIVPYAVDADTMNRGWSFAYQPRYRWNDSALELKITPAGIARLDNDRHGYSQLDLSYRHGGSAFSWGLGPTVTYVWDTMDRYDRFNLGAEVHVDLLRSFRLTFGSRKLFYDVGRSNYYLLLGFTDLPGILSRLCRSSNSFSIARR